MALATALLVGPAAHAMAAAPDARASGPAVPAPDATALLQAADEALERGDYAGAAEGFRASYRALSVEQQRSRVGARTIALAYDAYREAWHRGRDPAPLRAAQELLVEHIATLEPAGMSAAVQETRHRLEWIEHLLELEEASARATAPAACPEPAPQEAPVCPTVATEPTGSGPTAPVETDAPRRDVVGVALVAAGAVTLAGGVGLLIGGSRVLPTARQQIVAAGRNPDEPVPQDATYLQVHEERGRNLMIAGGVVAGVGAAAATWGLVRLIRRRSPARRAEAAPPVAVGLSPRGILLRARF